MTPDLKPRTEGIKVRFTGPNMGLALIPLPHMPMGKDSLISPCPPCGVIHLVKTIHLWLDDQGHAVVSQKVLDAFIAAGLPQLEIIERVKNPPTLRLGRYARPVVDYANRAIAAHDPQLKEAFNG